MEPNILTNEDGEVAYAEPINGLAVGYIYQSSFSASTQIR